MFSKLVKLCKSAKIGCLFATLVLVGLFAFSWIATCGLIYLITLCFGWTFSWPIATGLWLMLFIAKSIFSHSTTVKK
jgi:hypothetical protein